MNKHLNSLGLTCLLFILPVCPATIARAQLPETSDTNAKQTNLLKDELYFGLTKPGGETIYESEWQEFVKTVITPRFREGLTVLDGSGQFLNSSGIRFFLTYYAKLTIKMPSKQASIFVIIEIPKTIRRTFY